MVYSAGPCSVCGWMGDALIVRAVGSGLVFFVCPGCGLAWTEPPEVGVVETIDEPEQFAPHGFTVATRAEIAAAGWSHRVEREYPDEDAVPLADFAGFRPADRSAGAEPPAG